MPYTSIEPVFLNVYMEPRNRFQGMNSASLCSLAGRYDNPIPPRFLVPIDSLKIPALMPHMQNGNCCRMLLIATCTHCNPSYRHFLPTPFIFHRQDAKIHVFLGGGGGDSSSCFNGYHRNCSVQLVLKVYVMFSRYVSLLHYTYGL